MRFQHTLTQEIVEAEPGSKKFQILSRSTKWTALDLDKAKKSDLEEAAQAQGIDPSGKTKADLAKEIG